jgi:glucose/arabinose dehydrogenase
MRSIRSSLLAVAGALMAAAGLAAGPAPAVPARAATIGVERVAAGLMEPVAFEFAPDGRIFYVERTTGEVRIVDGSRNSLFTTIRGAESLVGLALHPDYPSTPWVYVWGRRVLSGTTKDHLVRITDSGGTGTSKQVIFGIRGTGQDYGGDVDFGPDGKLYLETGDQSRAANAQDLSSPSGKILRMNASGGIPASGNPFPNSRVWAYGLRNSIGMTFDPANGRMWMVDNGPQCNDEVNRIIKGRSYGWGPSRTCATPPAAPLNTNQDGPDPVLPTWWSVTPIGPTGTEFCSSCRLGARIEGRLLFGDVLFGQVHAATLNDARTAVVSEEVIYTHDGRIFSIETGLDGSLYFSNPGGIYKLVRTAAS